MIDATALNKKLFKFVAPVVLLLLFIATVRTCIEPKQRIIGETEYNLAINTARAEYADIQNIDGIKVLGKEFTKKGAVWGAGVSFNLDNYDESFFPNYLLQKGWLLKQDKVYIHPSSKESRRQRIYCKNGVALYMDDIYIIGQQNRPDGVSMRFEPYFCEVTAHTS